MKKYDLSAIMRRAWAIFRKAGISFAEALHRAWSSAKARPINAETIRRAKEAANVTEEAHTWQSGSPSVMRSSVAARPFSGRSLSGPAEETAGSTRPASSEQVKSAHLPLN